MIASGVYCAYIQNIQKYPKIRKYKNIQNEFWDKYQHNIS